MKVAILAGGHGTRLAEETQIRPKPMVEIGGRPILWHIMMHYSRYSLNEFVVALGYKGEYIKRYFADYCSLNGDLTVRMGGSGGASVHAHERPHPPWTVESGRDRRRDADRRTGEAARPLARRRHLHADLGRRRFERRPRRAARLPPQPRQARDGDRGAAARPLRAHGVRRRPGHPFRGEAAGGGGLDQRRLLRARAARCSSTSPATRRCSSTSRSSSSPETAS